MTKINTEGWKEYRVGDIFTQERGKEKAPKQNEAGDCPLIQETNTDNGFCRMVKPTQVFPGNAITISINYATNVFYQPKPFCASVNIAILYNDNLNLRRGQFVAAILSSINKKYDYNNKINKDKINDTIIKLPATASGEIDWNYIEEFMSSCELKASNNVERVRRGEAEPHFLVDTSDWGSFKISELFNCYHGQRQKASERIDGDIPLVTAGKENLGIAAYISNPLCLYNKAITINMFGNCFYHNTKCAGDDNVYFFVNDDISEYSKLFITSVISYVLKNKYSYDKQFRQPDADKLIIKLPVSPDGSPNFVYMEAYAERCFVIAANKIAQAKALINAHIRPDGLTA